MRALLVMMALCSVAGAKTVVLKAARLFDGKSDQIVSPGLVVVSGETIAAIGVLLAFG
jgi:hypothetical protein